MSSCKLQMTCIWPSNMMSMGFCMRYEWSKHIKHYVYLALQNMKKWQCTFAHSVNLRLCHFHFHRFLLPWGHDFWRGLLGARGLKKGGCWPPRSSFESLPAIEQAATNTSSWRKFSQIKELTKGVKYLTIWKWHDARHKTLKPKRDPFGERGSNNPGKEPIQSKQILFSRVSSHPMFKVKINVWRKTDSITLDVEWFLCCGAKTKTNHTQNKIENCRNKIIRSPKQNTHPTRSLQTPPRPVLAAAFAARHGKLAWWRMHPGDSWCLISPLWDVLSQKNTTRHAIFSGF